MQKQCPSSEQVQKRANRLDIAIAYHKGRNNYNRVKRLKEEKRLLLKRAPRLVYEAIQIGETHKSLGPAILCYDEDHDNYFYRSRIDLLEQGKL